MKTTLFALAALLALPAAARADEPAAPGSENALFFRIDVGVTPGRIVAGWIDERGGTGTGYDAAFLDLDGDGTAETVREFPSVTNAVTKETRLAPKFSIPHEGGTWVVDLAYSTFRIRDGIARPHFRWSVTHGDLYAWFINGWLRLYTDAAAAAAADPIRLGPPFRFEAGTATRGRDALVRIGLKDGNGATMRLARRGGKALPPELELVPPEGEPVVLHAEYG